jgi:hypothetical protein
MMISARSAAAYGAEPLLYVFDEPVDSHNDGADVLLPEYQRFEFSG